MMNSAFSSVIIFLLALSVNAQVPEDYRTHGSYLIRFTESPDSIKHLAENDIRNGMPYLLMQSGISLVRFDTDSIFEQCFDVLYFDYGCIGPSDKKMAVYNNVMFEFLDQNYGHKWRRKIRSDVAGFRSWRWKNLI